MYSGIPILGPPRETKIASKNRRVREINGKITAFDGGGGTNFGWGWIPLFLQVGTWFPMG